MFSKVAAFHNAFGQTVATEPTLPGADTRAMRRRLLDEEFKEFLDADAADDLIEIADGLADLAYIACGTMLCYGLAPAGTYVPRFTTGAVLRPALPVPELREHARRVLHRVIQTYHQAEFADSLSEIDWALHGVLDGADVAALAYDIPLLRVFEEVHRSNMTKLDSDGRPLTRADGKVIKGPHYSCPDIADVFRHSTPGYPA